MKKFYVLWTYYANYSSLMEIDSDTAENAAKAATYLYGESFRKIACVYVFDKPPAFQILNKSE